MRHFSIEEFTKSATAEKLKIDNTPSPAVKDNLEFLCYRVLDRIREAYNRPIYISSGYRSPELNRAVGGASTSQHVSGLAADIYVKGESNIVLVPLIVSTDMFDQCIIEKGDLKNPRWIHTSTSRIRNRKQILFFDGKAYKDVTDLFTNH